MGPEVIAALTGLFCTIVSSIVTFILTKKKYNTEVESQQIKNITEGFDIYKKTMEESLASQKKLMATTIESQNQTIKSQDERINELQKENAALRKQVSELQMQLIKFFGSKFHEDRDNYETSEE